MQPQAPSALSPMTELVWVTSPSSSEFLWPEAAGQTVCACPWEVLPFLDMGRFGLPPLVVWELQEEPLEASRRGCLAPSDACTQNKE